MGTLNWKLFACIIMVLNLVRLAGQASLWLIFQKVTNLMTFSAKCRLALAASVNMIAAATKTADREFIRWKIAC